jgi:hypothetical protein
MSAGSRTRLPRMTYTSVLAQSSAGHCTVLLTTDDLDATTCSA